MPPPLPKADAQQVVAPTKIDENAVILSVGVLLLVVIAFILILSHPSVALHLLGTRPPISIQTRSGFLVNRILVLRNEGNRPLTNVVVRVRNPTLTTRAFLGTIEPTAVVEPNWNWSIEHDDILTITCDQYSEYEVPIN